MSAEMSAEHSTGSDTGSAPPRSEPRRILALLALTCALTLALDRALALPLAWGVARSELRMSRLYAGRAGADVLVLGNSRGVKLGEPSAAGAARRGGLTLFNLSYNGMSMGVAEVLLRDHLDRNPAPRVLMLEVTNLAMRDQLLKALTPYLGESPRLRAALRAHAPAVERAASLSHLFRYNQELAHRALYHLSRSDQPNALAGAARPELIARLREETAALRAGLAATARGPLRPSLNPLPAAGEGYEALLRLLRLCAARGIAARLVASPYLPAYAERLGALPAWVGALRAAVEEAGAAEGWGEGVRLFDYSALPLPDDHFIDPLHMNTRGIRALDERMAADGVYALPARPARAEEPAGG